jgi:hypothetical protein
MDDWHSRNLNRCCSVLATAKRLWSEYSEAENGREAEGKTIRHHLVAEVNRSV